MAVNQFLIDFELRYAWGANLFQIQIVGSPVNRWLEPHGQDASLFSPRSVTLTCALPTNARLAL
jgi:hypothetical protein